MKMNDLCRDTSGLKYLTSYCKNKDSKRIQVQEIRKRLILNIIERSNTYLKAQVKI